MSELLVFLKSCGESVIKVYIMIIEEIDLFISVSLQIINLADLEIVCIFMSQAFWIDAGN